MTLRQLTTLRALKRMGTLSGAGRELRLSQPAVSLQMKELGAEIGVELFRMRGKRLELSDAGEELVRYAERILGLVEEAPEAARAKARRGGLVRVAASSTPGVSLLPDLIARYRKSKPDVLVTLTVTNTEDVEEKIRRADVDLGVVGGRLASADLALERWWEDELVLVVSASHRFARRRQVSPSALARELLLSREHGSATRTTYEAVFLAAGLPLPQTHVVGDTEAIKRAVAAGMGIALLSRFSVAEEVKGRRLAALRLEGVSLVRPLHLLLPTERYVSPAVSEFVEFLRGVRQPGRRAKRSVTARAFDGSPPVARHSRRSSTEIHSEAVISATSSSERRHEVAARTR
jgi:LysR family transcriptional regulator, transcriptional activator of the cysJI operon